MTSNCNIAERNFSKLNQTPYPSPPPSSFPLPPSYQDTKLPVRFQPRAIFEQLQPPAHKFRTLVEDWESFVPTSVPGLAESLVVLDVQLVKRHVSEFQHELLRIGVQNTTSGVKFVLTSSRDLYPDHAHKLDGRAYDEIHILSAEEQTGGFVLRQLTWHTERATPPPPLLVDVLRLLFHTSKVPTHLFCAKSLNSYRFAMVGFTAIERFQESLPELTIHKSCKLSALFGFKLISRERILVDVIDVLAAFFRAKERELESA